MVKIPDKTSSTPVTSLCVSHGNQASQGYQDHYLLSAIVNSSNDAILSKSLDGIITSWNPAAERMFGYTAEEIIGRTKTILFPIDRLHEEQIILDRLLRGIATHHFETVRLHRNGMPLHVSVTISPVKNEDGQVIGASTIARAITQSKCKKCKEKQLREDTDTVTGYPGITRDITVRKQAEQALLESEARFRAFMNEGSQYAWITDSKGVIHYLNAPYCAMIARTPEMCLGKTMFDLYPEEVARDMLANIQQVARTGETLETIEAAPLPDGKRHYFLVHKFLLGEINGRVLVGGSAIDITARREAEQALQRNEERLREAQRVARIGSWERDLVTGQVSWSEEMFQLYRFDPAEGIPGIEHIKSRIHSEDWERYQHILAVATRDGKPYECDLRLVFEDGTIIWGHAIANVECDATGRVVRRFGTFMDVTEQRRLDAQLQQNLRLVQEQNRELEAQRQELAAANTYLANLAIRDGLTGAKNHYAFQDRLTEEFQRAKRTYHTFSIILLDVDNFKHYNDNFGHPEGDQVLKQVVRVLQQMAREIDFVGRYGGEEFVVILPETGLEGAMEAAERFRTALEAQEWPLHPVTASFGVATLHVGVETAQQLVSRADKALYASKEAGRNCVTCADANPVVKN